MKRQSRRTTRQGRRAVRCPPSAATAPLRRLVPLLGAVAGVGASAIDGFDLPNAEVAARYQRALAEFRCPKCLNESLASSGAPIAVDLRRTVRRLLVEGKSDDDIRRHLQERYGDFVLYDPPLRPVTWFLWFSPLVLAVTLAGVLARHSRRRPVLVTDVERAKARRLVEEAVDTPTNRPPGDN